MIAKYTRQFAGGLAQMLQRVTGLLLLLYLLLHVRTIHALREGPAAFDNALATFRNPLFKVLEIGLLGVVILHAMNGVRITLLDLGIGQDRQRQMFWWIAVALGGGLFLLGATPLFLHSVMER